MESFVTDLGILYPDLSPFTVRGWMKTFVDGPNNRYQDMALLYTVVRESTGRRVPGLEPYRDAVSAWAAAKALSKSEENRATLPSKHVV